jgi:phosphate-selective porin OprO/OprP
MKRIILSSLLALAASVPAETIDSLDQRLKIAERKLELADEAAAAAKASNVTANAGSGGFSLASADKGWNLKFSGVLQVDSRNYFEDQLIRQNNVITPRRGRLQLDAGLSPKAKLRLQTELVTGGLVDAYGELKPWPWATLRLGLQKTQLSLERWRSDPARDFVELGYTGALVTDRDTGAWLELADADQALTLGVGVFNGSVDNSAVVVTDGDDDKDVVAKVFTHPFRFFDVVSLQGLGVGVAASAGNRVHASTPGANQYRPLGQGNGVFSNTAGTEADGASLRVVPQAYWFYDSFSFLGEYARSSQQLSRTASVNTYASHEAYQVQLGWVLTGEDVAFTGLKLNPDSSGSWGALQVVARYQGVNFDPQSFPVFANPATSVSAIRAWGVGLNYVPVNNVKLLLDWEESAFTDGAVLAGNVVNRESDKVLFARAQFTY